MTCGPVALIVTIWLAGFVQRRVRRSEWYHRLNERQITNIGQICSQDNAYIFHDEHTIYLQGYGSSKIQTMATAGPRLSFYAASHLDEITNIQAQSKLN